MTNRESQDWYPYEERIDDLRVGAIDARTWLDKPAGKHGWLQMQGNKFVFENGTPITFWGTNVTESRVHPDEKFGRAFVNKLATHGMNAIRFHKFTWPTTGVVVSEGRTTELDPEKMDRMDRFFRDFKEEGIYVTWSHVFGHMVSEFDELASGFVGMDLFYGEHNSYGLVNIAEDLQDLVIELTVRLLEHRNPYTGLRYADDPALAMIELQNEDNIFFFGEWKARKYPFYSKLLDALFNTWLQERYGSEETLAEVWGAEAFGEGESLRETTISFQFQDIPLEPGQEGYRPGWEQRLLDSALFLHETQNRYYERYTAAIRATGYKGVLIGSPWLTHGGIAHYYNLLSDAMVGAVDRHEYWGGGEGHVLTPGKFNSRSMLESPGTGLLKSGLERVEGRPFLLSEWNAIAPNQWLGEGPFLIAAYGIGLQGWAGSFSYALDHFGSIYSAHIPPHLGHYPLLARMIYRGDIREAEGTKLLEVDMGAFHSDSTLPEPLAKEWLAVCKTGVRFVDWAAARNLAVGEVAVGASRLTVDGSSAGAAASQSPDVSEPELDAYWDREARTIRSETGQLVWEYGERTVLLNTPGTQGFVGFGIAGGAREFDDWIVDELETPFASILLGSLDREPIRTGSRLLLSAQARSRWTGMTYSEDGRELVKVGQAPLLLEPVVARITLKAADGVEAEINVLDQQGCRTGRVVPSEQTEAGFSFRIDGSHQAFWYEIVVKR